MSKQDQHAEAHWGRAYDAIPKSVFATLAWHLANAASDACDAPGSAENRAIEEVRALASNGILPDRQAKVAVTAILAALAAAGNTP